MVELNVMLYMKHLAWELALSKHSVFEQMPPSLYYCLIDPMFYWSPIADI